MKIGVIIERIEPWRGGAETSTEELSELLAARGHDVHVITSSRRPSTPTLTIHTLEPRAIVRPLATAAFVRRAAAFIDAERFDATLAIAPVPNAHVYQPRGGSVRETLDRNLAMRPPGAKRLLKQAAHSLNPKFRGLLRLEREICRPSGPLIAAVSRYVADQFERHYGLTAPRVQVVFNGVEVAVPDHTESVRLRGLTRAQYGWGSDEFVMLCVAHNFRLKGVHCAVRALGELVREGRTNARLLIIGRDNPIPIQRLAMHVGVADRVIFGGPTQRIGAFLAAASVCVHATYYDPCSRIVLEAICHGLPVITTRQNGAAEAVREGIDGYVLTAPDEPGALADRLNRVADGALAQPANVDESLRYRLSMRRHVAELEQLLLAAAGGPNRSGRANSVEPAEGSAAGAS